MRSTKISPNSEDHPEVVEWMKKYSEAKQKYVNFNDNDPSNFLDESHRVEIKTRLYEDIEHANAQLMKWCKHYGIDYNDAH